MANNVTQEVLDAFQDYQRARVLFVQRVANLARFPANVGMMQNAGVMNLLKPLLDDNVSSIQQGASVTLGRLASKSEKVAQAVGRAGLLEKVVKNLDSHVVNHKISAAYIIRAVSKHSPDLAADCVTMGAVPALKACLQHIDPGVKEAACWAIDYIAQHNADLAKAVADAEMVPLLVLAVQEPEVTLKRIAVSCLGSIAKHSPGLAQTVLGARCLPHFGQLLYVHVCCVPRRAAPVLPGWSLSWMQFFCSLVALARACNFPDVRGMSLVALPGTTTLRPVATLLTTSSSAKFAPVLRTLPSIPSSSQKRWWPPTCCRWLRSVVRLQLRVTFCAWLFLALRCLTDLRALFLLLLLCCCGAFAFVSARSNEDELLSKNACVLLKELSRQSAVLAAQVVENDGIGALMENIRLYEGASRTASVMGLGFLAASSEDVAMTLIESQAVPLLRDILVQVRLSQASCWNPQLNVMVACFDISSGLARFYQEQDQNTLAASAWTLGQIGKHSVEHAVSMGEFDVYRELIAHFQNANSSEDLQLKCKKTLKALLANCADLRSLEPLLGDAPPKVQK